MQQAMGWLRWSSGEFWGCTLYELTAALDGFLETRGQTKQGMPEDLVDELIEMVEAEEAREREEAAVRAATPADLRRLFG